MRLVDVHGAEQSASSDSDAGMFGFDAAQSADECRTQLHRPLGEVLLQNNVNCLQSHSAGQRVACKCGAVSVEMSTTAAHTRREKYVLSMANLASRFIRSEYHADWIETARQGFSNNNHIRLDTFFLISHKRAGPSEPGLNLIHDEKRIKLGTEAPNALNISVLRWQAAGVALNTLDYDSSDSRSFRLERVLKVLQVIEAHNSAGHL